MPNLSWSRIEDGRNPAATPFPRTIPMPDALPPTEVARRLGAGLLSFPVTPFAADLSFDEARYRRNLDWLCGYDVAGLFAAGGTGEFFSLTPAEVARVVAVAVAETN